VLLHPLFQSVPACVGDERLDHVFLDLRPTEPGFQCVIPHRLPHFTEVCHSHSRVAQVIGEGVQVVSGEFAAQVGCLGEVCEDLRPAILGNGTLLPDGWTLDGCGELLVELLPVLRPHLLAERLGLLRVRFGFLNRVLGDEMTALAAWVQALEVLREVLLPAEPLQQTRVVDVLADVVESGRGVFAGFLRGDGVIEESGEQGSGVVVGGVSGKRLAARSSEGCKFGRQPLIRTIRRLDRPTEHLV